MIIKLSANIHCLFISFKNLCKELRRSHARIEDTSNNNHQHYSRLRVPSSQLKHLSFLQQKIIQDTHKPSISISLRFIYYLNDEQKDDK